ncbi:hypothetical protein QEJ31_13725 [Pigmentibacter sp. JX0631]|uniref:hypothetical protein n=1 Tax=Pigmentibacter sp. JX0631 TaxID=2976982 RepID=UPI002468560A|nr:hypothetical protein [Pigmentibacter sp. JX0631]WGL59585.1 hypothetical protein QEJ31_13725 [Pigmentibacter sp. JX0631]
MKSKLIHFFFAIFFTIHLSFILYKFINPSLVWTAFPISLLALRLLDVYLFQGQKIIKTFSNERIQLNLSAAGFSGNNYIKKFNRKKFFLFFLFIGSFFFTFKEEFHLTVDRFTALFQNSYPVLKIEYPSYLSKNPLFIELSKKEQSIEIDSSYYLEINVNNLKKSDTWQVFLIDKNQVYPEKNLSYQMRNGSWSSSVQEMYASFAKDMLNTNILTNKDPKNIELIVSNKEKIFKINLKVNLTLKPEVVFESILKENLDSPQLHGKLNFKLSVNSKVPLTNIELNVRTKSGYSFKKTIAEFANAAEFEFNSESVELVTLGIPFLAEDILYVKANAKTVLSDLVGESKELQFPIKTPLQVRGEIIKNLEDALNRLTHMKKADTVFKSEVLTTLSKSSQLSINLSQSGVVRRNILEAMSSVENMSLKNDSYYEKAKAKIITTLNILNRQQKANETNNFMARLLNLKNNLLLNENVVNHKNEFRSEAAELQELASGINLQIKKIVNESAYPLSNTEKKSIITLLNADKTSEKLKATEKSLSSDNIYESQNHIQKAMDEANNHLGFAMQLLQQARLKAMQEAKIQLNHADLSLENSKYATNKSEVLKSLEKGKTNLDKTPRLGGEFNEFLQDAKNHTKKTIQAANSDSSFDKLVYTQKAQEAVERAILSLQDEEDSDKDMQKEQEAHSYRSMMDILSAQSTLDSTWRKKILDEISKLKSQGETSDSPMIRYLESRLR